MGCELRKKINDIATTIEIIVNGIFFFLLFSAAVFKNCDIYVSLSAQEIHVFVIVIFILLLIEALSIIIKSFTEIVDKSN